MEEVNEQQLYAVDRLEQAKRAILLAKEEMLAARKKVEKQLKKDPNGRTLKEFFQYPIPSSGPLSSGASAATSTLWALFGWMWSRREGTAPSPRLAAGPWMPDMHKCSRGKPQHRKRQCPREQPPPDQQRLLPLCRRPRPAPLPSITPSKTGNCPRMEELPLSASATGRGGRSSACGPETTGSWPRVSACGMCG